ncbi:MAG: hypothetical protein GY803_19930 [Chloroflexi bacterium]|nr:hypothetical protein [Chloroflexota bacterium]
MTDSEQDKYLLELVFYSKDKHDSWFRLKAAICLVKLGKYTKANHEFSAALSGGSFQNGPGFMFFLFTGQIEKLVEAYILASQPTSFSKTLTEQIEAYKLDPRGDSLYALYTYALMCLLNDNDQQTAPYVSGLLKKPKVKETYAIGKTIQSILDRDQHAFDVALNELLMAHRGMAKFGSLRETPEGFLSLAAMTLSKMALDRNMTVNAESEYLSEGYLDYLLLDSS